MLQIIMAFALVIGVSFLLLGFNIFFRKNRKFPETEVGHNQEMRKRGINCAKTDEIVLRRKLAAKPVLQESACGACGLVGLCDETHA